MTLVRPIYQRRKSQPDPLRKLVDSRLSASFGDEINRDFLEHHLPVFDRECCLAINLGILAPRLIKIIMAQRNLPIMERQGLCQKTNAFLSGVTQNSL